MLKKRRACEQLRVWSYRRLPEHGVDGGGAGAEAQEAAAQAEGAWEAWVGSGSRLQEGESCAA